jgi:hypothetical protein
MRKRFKSSLFSQYDIVVHEKLNIKGLVSTTEKTHGNRGSRENPGYLTGEFRALDDRT